MGCDVDVYDIMKNEYIKDWNFPVLPRNGDNISVENKTYECRGVRFYENFIRIWVTEVI